ncbi:autotransporter-associated N-terminal domain-containing protein [Leptotrichia sp. oral taxon 212]|uniref:autotransporter-associated N-terminal domain-containing protein n=1 Tax=Leptotrichia sp. oral taxon 212 TaxID=712357 RepID=UPI0006A9DA37|nr:autotransporter-associated N-terminal domain-containing protein [Leptotrichia sp. oral taxon 212]ALA95565.1 hypothetical protein AMK43_05540 [Leptotrichia sp. oral taxon 212]
MDNNLRNIEKTLRNFVKRCKGVAYTKEMLFTFLLTGSFAQAAQIKSNDDSIQGAKKQIENSIGDMKKLFKEAKHENNKLMKNSNLELIQLMEQGDHVVKSPWSSWQFGMNYFYSDWRGTYKGRGDKKEKYPYEGIFQRSEDAFERYTSPLSEKYKGLPTSTNPYSASSTAREGLNKGYGISSTSPKQEPLSTLNVDASIRPKDVFRDAVEAPVVSVPVPQLSVINVPNLLPPSLNIPTPATPTISLNLPTPNTNPFTDFCFTCGTQNGVHQVDNAKAFNDAQHNSSDGNDPDKKPNWTDGGNNKFWTGYNPVTGLLTPNSGTNGNIRNFSYSSGSRTNWAPRTAAALYFNKSYDERARANTALGLSAANMKKPKPDPVGFEAKNIEVYVAGNVSDNAGNNAGKTNGNHDGAIGIHTVWDGTLSNIKGHLYGRANFLSIETWHSGRLQFNNVSINIERDDSKGIKANENTLFYIYPATYDTIASHNYWAGAPKQRGGFIGKVDAKIASNKNIVYSVLGAQGSFEITSTGKYELEGADNIVYSGLGYSPNFNNLKGSGIVEDLYNTGLTPSIKLDKAPESYGDGNVVMLFNNRISLAGKAFYDSPTNSSNAYISNDGNGPVRKANWEKSGVGIYQGEIRAKAIIGNQLNMANSGTQTAAGNTTTIRNGGIETERTGDANYVENNIGIYARSGQRGKETINGQVAQIKPSEDLGAKDAARNTNFDLDEVHSLQVNDIDISFGKYAKNGIMMVSENGTVLDVAMSTNKHQGSDATTVPIMTGDIKDYGTVNLNGKISYNDAGNEAATGTIIAYSDGKWQNAVHGMTSAEAGRFEGKPSEINIGRNVVLTGRYKKFADGTESTPVAYVAKNGGEITAHEKTSAKGFGGLLAYAEAGGKVTLKKEAESVSEWAKKDEETKPYLYENIGGYAKGAGSTVTFEENLKINGMAGFADGTGAVVNLNKNANKVQTGKGGALVALNGGVVNFGGGDIYHETNVTTNSVGTGNQGDNAGNHAQSTPFFAGANSKVNFTGTTTINMSDGILKAGETSDYTAAAGTATKYNGMQNVKVKLTGDNVVLAAYEGNTTNWTGSSAGSSQVMTEMKINPANFNPNGKKYKIFYINGIFNLNTNLDLDDANNEFNKSLGLSNEKFNIGNGITVSSLTGKGLVMGSNSSATDNTSNLYNNEGTVDIKGGNVAGTTALNISYGTIHNKNLISVDKGIGAYGINGSKLINDQNANINITGEGVGMAAFTSGTSLQDYGTDKNIANGTLGTAKTLEILNKGTITVNGDTSVGIYGKTDKITGAHASTNVTRANGLISNEGKITMTGNKAVGIVSNGLGNTVTLKGTGSSDIVIQGTEGIGVYAENSDVNLLTNYGIEVKDKGTGIFVKDGSNLSAGTLELKYSGTNTGTGVGLFYDNASGTSKTNNTNVNLVDTAGTTGGVVGLYVKGNGGVLTNNGNISGDKGYGLITEGTEVVNAATITLNNPVDAATKKPSVGIYTKATDKITNNGTVTVGENSVGIYGHAVDNNGTINTGEGGTGIYSSGGDVNLNSGSINVGTGKAAAVYTNGSGQTIRANSGSTLTIGDNSFGFINEGKTGVTGNRIISDISSINNLGNDTVYVYSADSRTGAEVINNTNLTSTGSYNYGLYSAGKVTNNADINFGSGFGNVGIYSTHGGEATNAAGKNITVGASFIDENNSLNNRYAVGMAAGFNPTQDEILLGKTAYTGNIINKGIINVTGSNSIGMYGTGQGTKVINAAGATINLNASNTTGMYLDNGAYGYNYGTIRSNGTGLEKVVGVVVKNGSTIENHGDIILDAKSAVGILAKGDAVGNNLGIIKNYKTMVIQGEGSIDEKIDENQSSLGKGLMGVSIDVPKGSSVGTISVNGTPVVPTIATSSAEEYKPMQTSTIGMYIDTSSKRFTNPVQGLSALSSLTKADLIIGAEAAENTTSKYIQLDKKILDPYNEMIKKNPQIKDWNIYSGSLTWMATVAQNQTDGTIENAYMAKIPYTFWAGKEPNPVEVTDTYNFLNGMEQRYGVEELGTREKRLFDKISGIGNNEQILFFQAIDEMMGHQYANVQQRTYGTGRLIDKEITHLSKEWDTKSKQSNKIKAFGMRDEYKTDTAGIIDYTSNAYGFAYLHEDETVKLGNSSGWYAGAVHNRFKFKDIGKSKENQTMLKLGIFKTMSLAADHNGSLRWTISGEGYVSRNDMHRKYLVVDEIFNAKSDYTTYGVAVKNELGYNIRTSERTSIRPYGSLKLEYGRFTTIKEKSGEMRLDVKGNDYYSIRPEVGVEFSYRQPMAVKTTFVTTLGLGYENELGKVGNVKNMAKVSYTDADWFNIRGEKDDRKGNFKADLNIGVENQRFGVTLNGGYDTKGKNVRGGIGFRAIY